MTIPKVKFMSSACMRPPGLNQNLSIPISVSGNRQLHLLLLKYTFFRREKRRLTAPQFYVSSFQPRKDYSFVLSPVTPRKETIGSVGFSTQCWTNQLRTWQPPQ